MKRGWTKSPASFEAPAKGVGMIMTLFGKGSLKQIPLENITTTKSRDTQPLGAD